MAHHDSTSRRRAPRSRRLTAAVMGVLGLSGIVVCHAGAQTPSSSASPSSSTSSSVPSTAAPDGPSSSLDGPTVPPDPSGTPFPAPLVAAVHPSVPAGPRPLRLEGFYAAPGLDDTQPLIAVRFAELIDLPDEPWRVSVVAGEAGGDLVRVSMVHEGEADIEGIVETYDGTAWSTVGSADVSFEPSGLVLLPLDVSLIPSTAVAAGPVIRAESVLGPAVSTSSTSSTSSTGSTTTPWYDLSSVLGTGQAGVVVSGRITELDGAVVDLGPGPVIGVAAETDAVGARRSTLVVRYDAPAPTEVDGRAVASAVDLIRVLPDFVGGGVATAYVEVDRTTGVVRLVDARSWPIQDVSGDRSWIRADATTGDGVGPGVLAFDLDVVMAALGVTPDHATVGAGATRRVRLADGAELLADGVLASTAWFDMVATPLLPTTSPLVGAAPVLDSTAALGATAANGSDRGVPVVGVVAVVLLAVSGLALIESGRRRRAAAMVAWESDASTSAARLRSPAPAPAGPMRQGARDVLTGPEASSGEPAAGAPPGAVGVRREPAGGPQAETVLGGADGPWWADARPAGAAPPRHEAAGVTIRADRASDLVAGESGHLGGGGRAVTDTPSAVPPLGRGPVRDAAPPPATAPATESGPEAGPGPETGPETETEPGPEAPGDSPPLPHPRVAEMVASLEERLRRLDENS